MSTYKYLVFLYHSNIYSCYETDAVRVERALMVFG